MPVYRRVARRLGLNRDQKLVLSPTENPRDFDGLLFICGLHRSGTTLLEHFLAAKCDVVSLRAPVHENEGQHLQDVYPRALDFGGPGAFAFAPEMHPSAPSEAESKIIRKRLMQCWSPWVCGDGSILMEKSPPNLTKMRYLRAIFPGARFIVITRDPRAVAGATYKWIDQSIREIIYHWHVAYDRAEQDIRQDCHHVRYEDFCADPWGETAKIIEALGLPARAMPKSIDSRFANISSTNDEYIRELPQINYGRGVWEKFGYGLSG